MRHERIGVAAAAVSMLLVTAAFRDPWRNLPDGTREFRRYPHGSSRVSAALWNLFAFMGGGRR